MAQLAEWGDSKLRWGRFSPVYRSRLLDGGQMLGQFLHAHGMKWERIKEGRSNSVDETLDSFVRFMHGLGRRSSLMKAKHAVLFVQTVRPRLHGLLKSTWNTLRSWEEMSPAGFRSPMPLPLLAALLCQSRIIAVRTEDSVEKKLWFIFAGLVAVSFFGMLRPGELFGLLVGDVCLPHSMALAASFAVIRLKRPKNARQMGQQQFCEVHHPDAINWLAWIVHTRAKKERALRPSTPARFRIMFKTVCEKMMVQNMKLSPASLRAGGATWMLDEGYEVSRIRFQGRWTNLRSLEHYLQVARAQQLSLTIPDHVALQLRKLLLKHSYMLSLPEFFSAQVPAEHLVLCEPCELVGVDHVVAGIRRWGRLAKAVQENSDPRRKPERSEIFRHRLGGHQALRKELQSRP